MRVGPFSLMQLHLGQTQIPTYCEGEIHEKPKKTYNTKDSPVVTDLSTDLAVATLTRGERTGSRIP